MRSSLLAKKIASLALTKKASDIIVMDLRKLTSMADFFVVCSADSDIQVKAIADAVEDGLQEDAPWHREASSPNWVLLDYVDVVLHVFHKNTRSFYNLEKLWGDAKFTNVHEDKQKTVKKATKKTPARRVVRKKRAAS